MTIESFAGFAIEFAFGNLAIALPLALVAWWLQRKGTQPFLAHLVWLVVLVKLVTPPLYSFRIDAAPAAPPAATSAYYAPPAGTQPIVAQDPTWLAAIEWQVLVVGCWLAGSLVVLVWSVARASRFQRLLRATSAPAPSAFQHAASELAATLGIRSVPPIMMTAARISPMVWWVGGPVRIYVPRSMIHEMSRAELCDILAHELGHVGRGDHYVRWLECLVGFMLWWNPFAWWARRNLRACEEICCDAFVLSRTQASRDAYAGALVSAMELLAAPTIRPSGMASHVNGGFIERRIRMILSGKSIIETPRRLRAGVIASAVLLLPLGFTLAQDADDDLAKARQWLESGVNSAFLTREQADIMLRALEAGEHGTITLVRDGDGNVVRLTRRVEAVGAGVPFAETATKAEIARALAFADTHFDEAALTGRISADEAEALKTDLRNAIDGGLAEGDGSAYYEQQFEVGLIDAETAERRSRMLRDMEQAWNLAAESVVVTRPGGPGDGPRLVKVAAMPIEVELEGEGVFDLTTGEVDFEIVRVSEGEPEVVRSGETE